MHVVVGVVSPVVVVGAVVVVVVGAVYSPMVTVTMLLG